MANAVKIVERMKNNPRDWRIEDLETVARRFGIDCRRPKSSHVVFTNRAGVIVTVPAARPILPLYVRKFLKLLEE